MKCKTKNIANGLLNTRQVAARLGVSPQTIARWEKAGDLGSFRFAGTLRFSESAIEAFIAENERVRDRQLDRRLA
jgi:excisionase family DNA binding protein